MSQPKPEGYPYATVESRNTGVGHVPVLVDWNPHGFEQVAEVGQPEEEYVMAKRAAVNMAKRAGCVFKVRIA